MRASEQWAARSHADQTTPSCSTAPSIRAAYDATRARPRARRALRGGETVQTLLRQKSREHRGASPLPRRARRGRSSHFRRRCATVQQRPTDSNGTRVAASCTVGFTLRAIWLGAASARRIPLAVAAQVAFEALFGDSLLLEEWLHGSRRTAAFACSTAGSRRFRGCSVFWAIVVLRLRRMAGAQQRVELWALAPRRRRAC